VTANRPPGNGLVVDPAMTQPQQRRLRRLAARAANPSDKMLIEYAGPTVLIVCLIAWLVAGLAAPWLWAAAVAAIASFAVRHEVTYGALRRHQNRYVDPSALDGDSRRALQQAQRAISDVVSSDVYRAGMLDDAASAVVLRWHEWDIARRLREITELRAQYARHISAGVPGPQTAAMLNAHQRAITIAQESITRRVTELVRYAAEVTAADTALRDCSTAQRVAYSNDRYRALVASTAADDHAIAEIINLIAEAARAKDTFETTLNQAMLAAQPLVLADTNGSEAS
jgi:hypothetical protein